MSHVELSVFVLRAHAKRDRVAILRTPPMAARANPVATDGAFTVVVESAPGMVWSAQPDGCRTFFNRTWFAFTGRTLDQESGDGWTKGIHGDDRTRALRAYRSGVRSGGRFEFEYRLRRHDGEFRHVLDRAAPRIERGTLLGYIGACLDIEDRKAAEVALRASETRFRLLTENAVDVVYRYRVHPTYGTEYMSPAALAVCGRSPEEFLANPELGFSLIHPEDRAIARSMRHNPENLGKPTILRWLHADGRIVWTEHRGTAVYDAEGRFVAIEGIARDITDRVRAEQQRQLVEA